MDLTEGTAVDAEGDREADGARLLEWTGERCVPWADDVQVVYEHLHRYHVAAQVVAGRRVLDLASGEGFGAAILAQHAAEVVGVDVDPRAVEHSLCTYRRPNLTFVEGSMLDPGTLPEGRFDVVTCFEAIEHVADHGAVLDAVESRLEPGGLLLLSTPDRDIYSDAAGRTNPFHVRELSRDELLHLLRRRFAHVQLWGQATVAGSLLFALEEGPAAGAQLVTVDGAEPGWPETPAPRPAYLFAAASARAIPPLPATSTLRDVSLRLLDEAARGRSEAEAAQQETARQNVVLEERQSILQEQLAFSDVTIHRLQAEYDLVRSTRGWRVLNAFRRVRDRARAASPMAVVGGIGGRTAARLRAAVPNGGTVNGARRQVDAASLALPSVDEPRVSIVIPTYNGYRLTVRCLRAIQRNTEGSFEVIVVDDASSDGTSDRLGRVPGVRVVRNAENVGFTESVIAGAEAARGELLLFLNNDTEVRPGWLQALIDAMEADPTVGAAGSKLLFPDGRLQEAGSIIWNDGTGANLGFGADPELPQHNYVRDVDYCSAAALMVRRSAYDEVGGFDRVFKPGYYEDTDLCFAIRARGHRVIYVPGSVVVHDHGASFGSEEVGRRAVGTFTKEAMHMNRHRFVAKWADELDEHWPSGTAGGVLGGRRDHRVRVLVCDYQVPARDRDSGGLRMTWIIRLLVQAGCVVSLLPLNGAPNEPYTGEFQRLGVEVLYGTLDWDWLLRSRAGVYDIALLSRPSVAHPLVDRIRAASPGTFVVYDTVDLHHVREARRLEVEGKEPDRDFVEVRGVERLLIRRSDLVATVSAEEAEVVEAFARGTATIVLPNVHEPVAGEVPGFDGRSDLLFIGSYQHPPNVDAMLWFVSEVLPLVRARVPVHLTILGQEPPDEVRALAGPDVTVTGYVPDVDDYFRRARVFVAPLRYGAGVKGKVGQAMSCGLPIVTTTIGAEGMGIVDGTHALVRDDPEAFAEAVVDLLTSEQLWKRLSASSLELVGQYSPDAMAARLDGMLKLATAHSLR